MKVRYVGIRDGYAPLLGKQCHIGDIYEVEVDLGSKLLSTKQFVAVREVKKKKEEPIEPSGGEK